MNGKILKTRKMKYGTVAAVYIAIFIAAVILINAIITLADSKLGLYSDLTPEHRYDISDATRTALSGLTDDIDIIFTADRDQLLTDDYMTMIVTLAEQYEREFPHIGVRFINYKKNNAAIKKYRSSTDTLINSYTIIFDNTSREGKYKLSTYTDFFSVDSATGAATAFKGERKITTEICNLVKSSENVITLTTGHGEHYSSQFIATLGEAGYSEAAGTLITVDISKGEGIPENTALLIIGNPKRDFLGSAAAKNENGINEIDVINRYLLKYGNIFLIIDKDTPDLPEIQEFIESRGISYVGGTYLCDQSNALSSDGMSLIANYNYSSESTHTYANAITEQFINDRFIMSDTVPLILDGSKYAVAPILAPFPTASVMTPDGRNAGPVSENIALMAISTYFTYDSDNMPQYTNLIVSGSVDFADKQSDQNGNKDLMLSILRYAGSGYTASDIDIKPFDNTSLSGVTKSQIKRTAIWLCGVIPALILIGGIIVYIRRKRL